jgi:glycosyltransferase involved in cell wall biosynthesis
MREVKLLGWLLANHRRFDVVHFRTHADRYFLAYLMLKLLGKRLVLSATLDDSVKGLVQTYRPAFRPIVARLFTVFDAFVSISPKLHEETSGLVARERAHLIPIGIQVPDLPANHRQQARERLGLDDTEFVLVFVGGISPRKDPLFLIEQLSAIRDLHPKIRLLLIGPILDRQYYDLLLTRAKEKNVLPSVTFIGQVEDASLFLSAADVMTFSSKLEGFGTVVIEAMAHGLPVVVRHLPGVNDYFIEQGRTGFYFSREDDFVLRLKALINDAQLRRRIGGDARNSIIDRFAIGEIALQYLDVYRLCAKRQDA